MEKKSFIKNTYKSKSPSPQPTASNKILLNLGEIDTKKLDKLYFGEEKKEEKEEKISKKAELLEKENKKTKAKTLLDTEIIVLQDSIKNKKEYKLTFRNYLTFAKYPEETDLCCFWDRHPFKGIPVGCPIQFYPTQVEKEYKSELTKEIYRIKSNLSSDIINDVDETNIKKILQLKQRDAFYSCYGIFCSFECVLAFINENEYKNPMYSNSRMLLYNIAKKYGIEEISPAPKWELLIEYGGLKNIKEFRKDNNKIDPTSYTIVRQIPVGILFQDNLIQIK